MNRIEYVSILLQVLLEIGAGPHASRTILPDKFLPAGWLQELKCQIAFLSLDKIVLSWMDSLQLINFENLDHLMNQNLNCSKHNSFTVIFQTIKVNNISFFPFEININFFPLIQNCQNVAL